MADQGVWIPYCGGAPLPAEFWARWNLDPILIAVLTLASIFYCHRSRAFRYRRPYFAGFIALTLILFVSPLCALSSALFAVRVTHHVLLSVLAAPLLVLALPPRNLPPRLGFWTGAQALLFWFWHAPFSYAWALSNDGVYWLMQASLLGASFGFWTAVRAAGPAAVPALLASMVQMGLLGALLTFTPRALYAPHFLTGQPWGYGPLEDQQLAGLIMWVPAAGVYLGLALFLVARWLGREPERAGT